VFILLGFRFFRLLFETAMVLNRPTILRPIRAILVAGPVEGVADFLQVHSQGLAGNWIKLFWLSAEVCGDLPMSQAFSWCQLCAE